MWRESLFDRFPKAVLLDANWFGPDISFDGLKSLPLEWHFFPSTFQEELIERLDGADIAIGSHLVFHREIFSALPDLKLLCLASTDRENVDWTAARQSGVTLFHPSGFSTFSVAQHTLFLMLALSLDCHGQPQKENFSERMYEYPIRELKGKKLGVVGFGSIGREVARLARAFGMNILVAEHTERIQRTLGALPLEKVLEESDYVTLHLPLTRETEGLISKEAISKMKKEAFLINTSRGAILDEEALAEALRSRQIAGAALDVLSEEPPSPNHPFFGDDLPNLILTPHIAWSSRESRMRLMNSIEQTIRSFLEGVPLNAREDQIAGVL